jgi:hypothetical protein
MSLKEGYYCFYLERIVWTAWNVLCGQHLRRRGLTIPFASRDGLSSGFSFFPTFTYTPKAGYNDIPLNRRDHFKSTCDIVFEHAGIIYDTYTLSI